MMDITSSRAAETGPALNMVSATSGGSLTVGQEPQLRAPDGILLVPSEDVLLLAVALPAMSSGQRRASIGYAIEDRVAQSLDDLHVVLGPQTSPNVWLVAVVARSALANFVLDKKDVALWPDVLLVPAPQAGWAVWSGTERALVRLPDGSGFATSISSLPAFWIAAGSPSITLYSGSLSTEIPVTFRAELPPLPDPVLHGFDLLSGKSGAGGRLSIPLGARPLFVVGLVAALAHLGLLIADVTALSRMAAHQKAELSSTLSAPIDGDIDAALAEALALRQPVNGGGGALGLITQVFSAISAQAGKVSVQNLRYAATENEAVMTIEAPDLATLQSMQASLSEGGLIVISGAATTRDGAAEVQMTVRGDGA